MGESRFSKLESMLPEDVDQLFCTWNSIPDDIVTEKNCKGFVSDMFFSPQNSISKTLRLFLPNIVDISEGRDILYYLEKVSFPSFP